MAVFKAPRITTEQRITLLLDPSEIVFDTNENAFYGGNGTDLGGFRFAGGTGSGTLFSSGSVVVGEELSFIDLDRVYIKLMSVAVGRLAIHEGEHFTASVVSGKTRLTWIGSLATPGGAESIETGSKIYYVGAY